MKTLNLLLVTLLAFTVGCSNAQTKTENDNASKEKTSQVRQVTGYSRIDVSEGIKVNLTLGGKEFVEVFADEDLIDEVITEVHGTTLSIHMSHNVHNMRNRNVEVNVTAKKVEGIDASSGSSVISQGLIESDNLELSVSSGAHLKVAFKAQTASCDASSGANAELKGAVKNFSADASSGAGIDADDLKTSTVKADVSSGAHIGIDVSDELNAEASSGGSIRYSGAPKMVDIEKSSGGSVKKN